MRRFDRFSVVAVSRSLLACLIAVFFSGCQTVAFSVLNSGSSALPSSESRIYDENLKLALDIHRPAAATEKPPIAVFFYGGSWRMGDRKEYAFVGEALASQGILTIVPDYRKFPEGRFPDFEFDAAHAVRWVFDHAEELGGDPQKIFVIGHSAGAHIAALLGTDQHYLDSVGLKPKQLAGIVGIAGPYDFLPLTDPDLVEVFGEKKDWPASQPVNFVDGDEPPFLLLQGLGDKVVWPRNSTSLQSRLEKVGVPVQLITYPKIGHFRIAAAFRFRNLAPTLRDTATFIEATAPSIIRAAPPPAADATSRNR
ncbi:MAG: alpha/beta hydrolase [Dokdonella sp.]